MHANDNGEDDGLYERQEIKARAKILCSWLTFEQKMTLFDIVTDSVPIDLTSDGLDFSIFPVLERVARAERSAGVEYNWQNLMPRALKTAEKFRDGFEACYRDL